MDLRTRRSKAALSALGVADYLRVVTAGYDDPGEPGVVGLLSRELHESLEILFGERPPLAKDPEVPLPHEDVVPQAG